jgi:serine/threonine protein kinase
MVPDDVNESELGRAARDARALVPASCLSSIECVAYLEGKSEARAAESVQHHLDSCERCRVLVAETARATFAGGAAHAAVVRALADGEKLGGRYEIRRFIARGGMGEVYEASDLALRETVALKTLSPTTMDDGDAVGRLIAEVRLARKVMHPHVCRILEFGLHRRQGDAREMIPFLTMDLLDGETLAEHLRREGPLDPARALRVWKELAAGLAAVHQAGIVHRDFKTENVFLVRGQNGEPSRAVVMDFGLARTLEINRGSSASSARGLIGTVAYMAPEQVEGQRPTPAFDVYALGIVAFEMVTGHLPFVGSSPMAVATLRLRQDAPRPSSLRPELGPAWDDVIGGCLARDPEQRFRHMDQMIEALDHAWSAAPASAPRSARSRSRVGLIAAGALLVSISGALVAVGFGGRGRYRGAAGVAPPAYVQPASPAASERPPMVRPEPPPVVPAAPASEPAASPRPMRETLRRARRRSSPAPSPGPVAPTAERPPAEPAFSEGEDDLINPFTAAAP